MTADRRSFLVSLGAALVGPAHAVTKTPAQDQTYTLAINEAATTVVARDQLNERYHPICEVLGDAVGRSVVADAREKVADYMRIMSTGPAFTFNKTVDLLAEQIRLGSYAPLVMIEKPYIAGVI